MRIVSVGHAVFAATMIALGILGFASGDFAAIWQPVPRGLPGREVLAGLCALVALASGTALLWRRTAAIAARVLFGYLLLRMLLFKATSIFCAPLVEVSYESCGETAVIVAGAWVMYALFAIERDQHWLGFATGDRGVLSARALYGLALIAFGLSHFAYAGETAALVPAWLPAPMAWAYFFGGSYIAAGVAMLTGVRVRLAAALAAVQMGVFTLLVWVPAVLTGPDPSQWSEFVVSTTLTAGAWVMADACRGPPGLAVGRR